MASTKKTAAAAEKKPITRTPKVKAEAQVATKPAKTTVKGLSADVFDLTGKVITSIELPIELFGAKINDKLMAQAVRVYLANQRSGTHSTKTRGEVAGSTRKIYRQKGTGRARHGGIRAPIFVGGGIAMGPKPRDHSLSLPQKMRKAALVSALTSQLHDGNIKIVDGLENAESKTKVFVEVLKKLSLDEKNKKILVVMPGKNDVVTRGIRNAEGVTYVNANQLNTYEILSTKKLLVMKSALETLEKTFGSKETK